jgi:hypothetical protein
MSSKITCPRCGQPATVTFSRRGTERIHTHKNANGERCRGGWSAGRNDNIDEDGSPLDADNDPDA